MRRTAVLATLCCLVAAPLVLVSAPADASCAQLSMQQRANYADAVFVGSVTAIAGHNRYDVRASDIYKGSPGAFVTVRTGPRDPNVEIGDSVSLEVDRQYVFFLLRQDGKWAAPGCLGTVPVSSRALMQADRVLGPATPLRATATPVAAPSESPSVTPASDPHAAASQASPDDGGGSPWRWLGAIALVAAGAGVALSVRSGRRA